MQPLNRLTSAMSMLCCPRCKSDLSWESNDSLCCSSCNANYPIVDGIIDLLPEYEGSKKILQWAMERKSIVDLYEDVFRPSFTKFFSKSNVSYDREVTWLNSVLPSKIQYALDLAAGTGRYTEIITSIRSPELVIAVDVSLPMLVAAKNRNERKAINNVVYLRADAHNVPLKDCSIDAILCFGAMHLFETPSAAISECSRVLQGNGTFSALTAGSIPGNEIRIAFLSKLLGWTFFDKGWLVDQFEAHLMPIMVHSQSSYVTMFSAKKCSQ